MARYEFKVLVLEPQHGQGGSSHRWCSDGCDIGALCELGAFLNRLGAEGWAIASYASDGYFGNTLCLQREKPEAEVQAPMALRAEPPKALEAATEAASIALLAEVQALRQAVEGQVKWPIEPPILHVAPAPVDLTPVTAGLSSLLAEVRIAIAGVAQAQQSDRGQAKLFAASFGQLERSLAEVVQSLQQATSALLAPKLVREVPESVPIEVPVGGLVQRLREQWTGRPWRRQVSGGVVGSLSRGIR